MKLVRAISQNTVSRLPKYIRLLSELENTGVERVSSANIGQLLGMTPSQIRQDLSSFGSYGAQGYGYSVSTLKEGLEKVMGLNIRHNVAVLGVGSIGHAFLCHMNFNASNYNVVAAFDINEEIIGTEVNGIPVYHADTLSDIHSQTPIDICILAVPSDRAVKCAKETAKIGIPAIWNLTNVDLALNDCDVVVEDMHFLDSLYSLTFYLEEMRKS